MGNVQAFTVLAIRSGPICGEFTHSRFNFMLLYYFKIERWWKELHERKEKYFKGHLRWLKDQGHYDPHNETDK
jgi:hypothetical protein